MTSIFSLHERLDTASFRGVPFSIPAEVSTTGGRKKVVHEFVNSDRRVVEDQGRYQKVFSVRGIITDADFQYLERRNALINALEKPDAGVLSHPFFGKINVVPDKYTISESFRELGRAVFEMTFYRAEDKIRPLPDAFTEFNVEAQNEQVIEFVGAEIIEKFKVARQFPFNFSAATSKLEAIAAEFDRVTTTFRRQLDEIDAFTKVLTDFRNSIRRLVNLPNELVASLNSLLDAAIALTETPREAFLTLEKFFPFGINDPVIPQTTFERIERLANRTLLNQYVQTTALSSAYNQSAKIDFFTVREIDSFWAKLEGQYSAIYSTLTNNDLASQLRTLRSLTNEFLDIQRVNVKKIVAFSTQPTTAQELTFRLYGNLDDYSRILALNSIKDVDFIAGDLEIFR